MRGALRLLLITIFHLGLLNASPFSFYNSKAVIQKLWRLKINSFNAFFATLTAQYVDDRNQLVKLEHCDQFIHHCQRIHHFLKYLFVVSSHNSLIYSESENEWMPDGIPLFSYWKSEGFKSYRQFYALYFDCLARLFVVAMHESWLNLRNGRYAHYRTKAEQFHAHMSMVLEQLIGSEYEERYGRQLARYYDLLNCAQSEKDIIETQR